MTETLKKYEIIQWDSIITADENIQRPIVYIKPDTEFLQFISDSNFTVLCKISDTGLAYDNYKTIYGKVNKSAYVPNYRPEFFEANGLYVITLLAEWDGYPEKNSQGTIVFEGINNHKTDVVELPITEETVLENSVNEPVFSVENYSETNENTGLLVSVGFVIIIILLLIYFIYTITKNIRGTV